MAHLDRCAGRLDLAAATTVAAAIRRTLTREWRCHRPRGSSRGAGTQSNSVYRTLADFACRGWVQVDGRTVLVLDREQLARRAS